MTEQPKPDEPKVEMPPADIDQGRDLAIKLGLAVFSFILGLLATVITNAYLRDRSQIVYAVKAESIVSGRQNTTGRPNLDAALQSLRNATEFQIRFENIGDLPVQDFAVRLVFNDEAKIATKSIITSPSREVPWEEDPTGSANQLRLKGVTLDRAQALTVNALIESPVEPHVDIFPFLAKSGAVNWRRVALSESLSLEAALLRLVQLGVLALVLPGLVVTIPQAVGVFFSGVRLKRWKGRMRFMRFRGDRNRPMLYGITIGQLIASLLRLYIVYSMIRPATVVVKLIVQKVS